MEAKMECILGSILDRFLVDFGRQVGTQNRPKRDKNRCQNGSKIQSFFEGLLERDFFGQEARQEAEGRTQVGSDAESAGRGEDYGGVHKTKFEGHLIRTLHKDWI